METEQEAQLEESPDEPAAERHASKRLRSILESLLFAVGDPIPLARFLQVLPGYEKRDVVRALSELGEEYSRDERGFRLQQVAGGYQLRTSPANADFVKALLAERPARLNARRKPSRSRRLPRSRRR